MYGCLYFGFPPILVSGLLTSLCLGFVLLFTCVLLALGTFTASNHGGFVVLVTYFAAREGVCVCECFLPIHSGHQIRWTYQPGSHKEGHTGFFIHFLSAVRALVFLARRIQPFLSLVDREVEFCVLTIYSFSTRWAFLFLFFIFYVRKIPFTGIELTSQRVRRLRGYL